MDWTTLNYIFWTVVSLLGIVGFINAFFSLKDRWNKWRATKSKEGFENRVHKLEMRIWKISKYKSSPKDFLIELLDDVMNPALSFLWAFLIFIALE